MLLPGGKGEIMPPRSSGQALAGRSHEIAYGLLVMTRVGMLLPSSQTPPANG
jgi:hypothetical protein